MSEYARELEERRRLRLEERRRPFVERRLAESERRHALKEKFVADAEAAHDHRCGPFCRHKAVEEFWRRYDG